MKTKKHIVIIGGGTGTFTLLKGLHSFPIKISVIVSTADSGGSTGVLRNELGVMPPGDLRQCLLGLSQADPLLQHLFGYRFDRGFLEGHTIGNIILAGLERITGSSEAAVREASRLLKVHGSVVPVTKKPTTLIAILENGRRIVGEHFIDEPRHDGTLRIRSLVLTPSGSANPDALRLIKTADAIVFGPGDLFTSTLPNIIVDGMAQAIRSSRAKKILVTNIMTKYGQTHGFTASDFLTTLEQYLTTKIGEKIIDTVIVNTKTPPQSVLVKYKKEHALPVVADKHELARRGAAVITGDFLSRDPIKKQMGDELKRSMLRHDSVKTARAIVSCLKRYP
ncbi:YvcK family protein [Candidatus Uhrbacteria bacterium]|nr:YvcK family protein [Candidatus Uhrbacteria bacterium]